ncbi:uncharacterized protein LOC142026015 [Buteo buteo]|uniref:uncharacterized protein LOC142026015 n=1 Tax=Buteo buteo TaxID=30397 RepID=UPI003EBADD75
MEAPWPHGGWWGLALLPPALLLAALCARCRRPRGHGAEVDNYKSPPCVPPARFIVITPSRCESRSAPRRLCPTVSLPHGGSAPQRLCPTASLPHGASAPQRLCPTAVLPHSASAPQRFCPMVLLPHGASAPWRFCPTALLPHSVSAPRRFCPMAASFCPTVVVAPRPSQPPHHPQPLPPWGPPAETVLQLPSPHPPQSRRVSTARPETGPRDPPPPPEGDDDYSNEPYATGYVEVLPDQDGTPPRGEGRHEAAPSEEYENVPEGARRSLADSLEYINVPPTGSTPRDASESEDNGPDYENL